MWSFAQQVRLKGTPTAESLSLHASGKLFRRSKNNRYTKSCFEDILIVSSFKALVTRCIQEYCIVVKSDLRVTYRTKTTRFLGQVYLNVNNVNRKMFNLFFPSEKIQLYEEDFQPTNETSLNQICKL